MLVAVAIFGLLTVALGNFLTGFLNLKFNAEMQERIRQEADYALDRVDFFVRNGVTMPDLCEGLPEGEARSANVLKVNTLLPDSQYLNYVAARVWYCTAPTCDPAQLYVTQNDNTSTRTHTTGVWESPSAPGAIALTSSAKGGSGHAGFSVQTLPTSWGGKNAIFTCRHDAWTHGYIVTTEFLLSYDRLTLNLREDTQRTELFRRETAVRNTSKFQ